VNTTKINPPEPPYDCRACPRLAAYLDDLRVKEPGWFNGPVKSFGSDDAELLIVGLAPGVSGANRTSRPFTGDFAGDLLYETLLKFGWASGTYDARPDDGLTLTRAMITNAVRCVPPENKPVGAEINECRKFLEARIDALPRLTTILALGKIAHDSTVRALGGKLKDYKFAHAAHHTFDGLALFDSYHCSRYNTNTRRLTPEMFENVFTLINRQMKRA